MSFNNGNGYTAPSYSASGDGAASYGSYSGGGGISNSANGDGGLRRRGNYNNHHYSGDYYNGDDDDSKKRKSSTVEKLDFMFPKVAEEFTVKTHGGGIATVAAYGLIFLLCLTEILNWRGQNRLETSTAVVDTSLGKKMRINMNVTFPSLACEDLHLDAIDVAGDSQLDIDDTMIKKRLHEDGSVYSQKEITVELNKHTEEQKQKDAILKNDLPENYCGPCYGAGETEGQCCQTCDEVIEAYKNKKWKTELLQYTAEQCVREGRDKMDPKKMAKGQGCNLSGYMTVNRVSGNFHIAMGEGVERDGRHIHTYNPEDAPNFNASHIIHSMSFGPEDGTEPLNGATKIVTDNTGTTGLFQYFIKIVPTNYVGEGINFPKVDDTVPSLYPEGEDSRFADRKTIETNRYFFTERFRPLMTELLEDEDYMDDDKRAAADTGYTGGHHNKDHHTKQNSVLPGVFFIYEIYPFAMEITQNQVPFTHLLIRLMATIGGVFTLARMFDSILDGKANRVGPGGRSPTKFSISS
mmetsp:Transcript_11956/g.30329  ORF Transcript_11956/g.30329 Transcript_11956/m.30329 type:complete len:522 (+) Transcript_11956:167-1732(+)|eukprot:CAMPEP_0116087136 /NCGR_PEP_ID=MMETSP0327-20121206/5211_1 /TAXON_ID=44447 /ORGANISM="Pseudo-nitzschia delicatissima, Strain B596" /LENGTH=521 /DNA_ID=CAMNT_0003578201 /DNA_START=70 /DNA_END=1638 /DNA_ORIENTATION=-